VVLRVTSSTSNASGAIEELKGRPAHIHTAHLGGRE
jgi:hypothetical protein